MFKKYIRATDEYTTLEKSIPAPLLRKGFELDFLPTDAKIYITTPGFYELYINGKNITKGFLAPYISNPNQMLCYDEYDIAPYLKTGKNAIGIILGNGFMNQTTPKWHFSKSSFSGPVSVALDLVARCGEKEFSLSADESFKVHSSPIVYDIYRNGTHYDARLEIDGWNSPDFNDSDWENAKIASTPGGELVPCTAHPIKIREELSPVSIERQGDFCYYKTSYMGEDIEITRVKDGYLYDFGINTAGVCKLKIKGKRGQKITLRHGERLAPDGKFNINTAYFVSEHVPEYRDHIDLFQKDVYILKGGEEEIFIPPFTYHGFRYAFVEGITEEQASKNLLTYLVFSSDIKRRASFNCSDELINKVYAMAINADLSNFHYFMTDCPQREKNGWMGDTAVSAEQVYLTFEASESFRLWLRAIRHSQNSEGALPGIVPTEKYGFAWGNGPMWDSAAINLPYAAYKYEGRIDIFEENAKMLDTYLRYIATRRDEKGLIACGLGDWCQPGRPQNNSPIKSPLALTDSVTTYDSALKAKMLFEKIGDTVAADFSGRLASELKKSIRENLIDYDTMTASGNCQTSQVYLIAMNIFTPEEYDAAYARLIDIINRDGRKLDTGMIGLRYIFEVLINGGDIDLAIELMLNDNGPSYKNMINRGATALCESLEDGTVNASENHHFYGDVIRVFTNYIAGLRINPELDDINEVLFSPVIPTGMEYANAEYKGVKAGWRLDGERISAYIDIPKGFHGKFLFGERREELKTGHNEFVI